MEADGFKKTTTPYKMIIMFGVDHETGEPTIGAQHSYKQEVFVDGELISTKELPPNGIDVGEIATSEFMSEAGKLALAQATRLLEENQVLKLQVVQIEADFRGRWQNDKAVAAGIIQSFRADAIVKNDLISKYEEMLGISPQGSAGSEEG